MRRPTENDVALRVHEIYYTDFQSTRPPTALRKQKSALPRTSRVSALKQVKYGSTLDEQTLSRAERKLLEAKQDMLTTEYTTYLTSPCS